MKRWVIGCGGGQYSNNGGFSLVELMVSIVFLLIAGALTARFYADVETQAEKDLRCAREGVMLLTQALGAYSFDLGKKIPTEEEGGLEVLVNAGYLEAVPKDPWGQTYQYVTPAVYSGRGYDLYSTGPDGVESQDDIVAWNLFGESYRGTSRIARRRDRALDEAGTAKQHNPGS